MEVPLNSSISGSRRIKRQENYSTWIAVKKASEERSLLHKRKINQKTSESLTARLAK